MPAKTDWVNGNSVDAAAMNTLGAEVNTKAPTASPTFTGVATTPAIKITTGAAAGKTLVSDPDGDAGWVSAPYDLSVIAFGKDTVRATGTGDFPFGVKLQRACTLTSVTYRGVTADASGNLVVELRKNGGAVVGSSVTIAAANQVAGGTTTGTWAFAAGDILTVQITAVGTTPGNGLIADITGVTP
jgi:hypothetical protein